MLRLNFHATLFEISAGQTFFSGGPDVARGPPIEEPCYRMTYIIQMNQTLTSNEPVNYVKNNIFK